MAPNEPAFFFVKRGPRSNFLASLDLFQTFGLGDIGLNVTFLGQNSVCPLPLKSVHIVSFLAPVIIVRLTYISVCNFGIALKWISEMHNVKQYLEQGLYQVIISPPYTCHPY